jgi:hypothetical protein
VCRGISLEVSIRCGYVYIIVTSSKLGALSLTLASVMVDIFFRLKALKNWLRLIVTYLFLFSEGKGVERVIASAAPLLYSGTL